MADEVSKVYQNQEESNLIKEISRLLKNIQFETAKKIIKLF